MKHSVLITSLQNGDRVEGGNNQRNRLRKSNNQKNDNAQKGEDEEYKDNTQKNDGE